MPLINQFGLTFNCGFCHTLLYKCLYTSKKSSKTDKEEQGEGCQESSYEQPNSDGGCPNAEESNELGRTQGGYNGHCAVGDLRRQMTGISNIRHLRHDSQRCDCAIKSFGQQTSREMTCYMGLNNTNMLSARNQILYQVKLNTRAQKRIGSGQKAPITSTF